GPAAHPRGPQRGRLRRPPGGRLGRPAADDHPPAARGDGGGRHPPGPRPGPARADRADPHRAGHQPRHPPEHRPTSGLTRAQPEPARLRTTTPRITRAIPTTLARLSGSSSRSMPITAIAAVPTPDQTAYAMLTWRCSFSAWASRTKDRTYPTTTTMV